MNPCFSKLHQNIQIGDDVAPQDVIWKSIDDHSGCPTWKSCTCSSRIDYRIPVRGNYTIQDWSNLNLGQDPMSNDDFINRLRIGKEYSVPWPLATTRWHHNQFVPLYAVLYTKIKPYGSQKFGEPLLESPITLT